LSGDKKNRIDQVYGVYFNDEGTLLGDKRFDIDKNDNIIVDGVTYAGTPGLFELIFKRIPDDVIYTEEDKQKYKSLLLATNARVTLAVRLACIYIRSFRSPIENRINEHMHNV
jgi:hypothetical protein